LMTKDKTIVPYLTDMRCIALPSNINSSIGWLWHTWESKVQNWSEILGAVQL
jgi:hypothetical protein